MSKSTDDVVEPAVYWTTSLFAFTFDTLCAIIMTPFAFGFSLAFAIMYDLIHDITAMYHEWVNDVSKNGYKSIQVFKLVVGPSENKKNE